MGVTLRELRCVPEAYSKYIAEFLGTFILCFTVGTDVINGDSRWAVTSIAFSLMVSVYMFGNISGAHLNPAVSVAIFCSKMIDATELGKYVCCQMAAGLLCVAFFQLAFGTGFDFKPQGKNGGIEAGIVEVVYTMMLCFVVLNVACSPKTKNSPNQFYGLAIGFVIVAGGYGGGAMSGGAFNPAVAFSGFTVWSLLYTVLEIVGAGIASLMHRVVRPKEYDMEVPPIFNIDVSCLAAEFFGTFFLVTTVGFNVLATSPAGAFSIAACLTCMVYSLGSVSGGHFNPAVTLAVTLSGRGAMKGGEYRLRYACGYVIAQFMGGISGGLLYTGTAGFAFPLAAGKGFGSIHVGIGETFFTMILCYVVLSVATTKEPHASKDFFGFLIGACVTIGGVAIGAISGGSLNPAVSLGIEAAFWFNSGSVSTNAMAWSAFECTGALIAVLLFRISHQSEFVGDEPGSLDKGWVAKTIDADDEESPLLNGEKAKEESPRALPKQEEELHAVGEDPEKQPLLQTEDGEKQDSSGQADAGRDQQAQGGSDRAQQPIAEKEAPGQGQEDVGPASSPHHSNFKNEVQIVG